MNDMDRGPTFSTRHCGRWMDGTRLHNLEGPQNYGMKRKLRKKVERLKSAGWLDTKYTHAVMWHMRRMPTVFCSLSVCVNAIWSLMRL